MGGGDLNAKKAWHPNTLKNQERVWKAEQVAAEEKKRIAELERERHLERERAELNKLAKSNMAHSGLPGDDRLHWMYEKPDKKVQQEEYLLGRAIDKNHEQSGKTEADEIPAVSRRVVGSSMLTAAGDTQVDLARKMREDPLLLVKERERAARAALLNNPVQRAKLTELLRKEQAAKNESKLKKKNKKSKDLDNILAEKLQALSGKKGIDLASLLASDDSSSESSDEKSKKKKKKKKKKSKSKHVTSDDSDAEPQKPKSKSDSDNKSKKNKKQNKEIREDDRDHARSKNKHQFTDNEPSKSHLRRYRKDSSDGSSSEEQQQRHSKYSAKNDYLDKSIKADARSDHFNNTKKRRHHSTENENAKSHIKKYSRDSGKDHQSTDDQQSTDNEEVKKRKDHGREDRYWRNKPYSNEYRKKDDTNSRTEGQRRDKNLEHYRPRHEGEDRYRREREDRHKDSASYRDSKNSLEDKYKKDKGGSGSNVASFDKGRQSNKRVGLSEAEKASKLAEMMAAGAERERQRERRVADQLAEKEKEEKPSTYSRARNAVQQLPESLESRIHSNRHYIQRDQRHMNENFARR